MRTDFIITVTNNIEGCSIEKYLNTICSNIVVGTNLFSDGLASFTDIFGGFSGTYKRKLELIYNEATKELKNKAVRLGANAIVGFSVDFDEISGGGKSMFMISASGTACVVRYPIKDDQQINVDIISQETLDLELKKRFIIKQINNGASIQADWREFLYEHPQKDILNRLLDIYATDCFSSYETDQEIIAFIEKHITLLPTSDIIDEIYSRYLNNSKEIGNLIKSCKLFSAPHILAITKENVHQAIEILEAKKDFYKKEDLVTMIQILHVFDSLPDTGKIEIVKGGLLSKDQEKFICANGHKSNKDSIYCENFSCGINIKGLTREEVKRIEDFRFLTNTLSDLLG